MTTANISEQTDMPTIKHYLPDNSPGHRYRSTPVADAAEAHDILKIAMDAAQHNDRTFVYIPPTNGHGARVQFADGEYIEASPCKQWVRTWLKNHGRETPPADFTVDTAGSEDRS